MRLVPPPRDVNLIGVTWREWWLPTARGWALLATAVTCIVRGLSYLDPKAQILPLVAYEQMLPPSAQEPLRLACVGAWCLVGVACLLQLLRRRWRISMSAAVGIHIAWALGSVASWILVGEPRAYLNAARDLQVAVLIGAVSLMLDPFRSSRRPGE